MQQQNMLCERSKFLNYEKFLLLDCAIGEKYHDILRNKSKSIDILLEKAYDSR